MMPPKALNVLASLRDKLIEQSTPEPNEPIKAMESAVRPSPSGMEKKTLFMRHAREHGHAFQQMCRRKDWASPVYGK